jgi:hypothetical protein
MYTYIHTYIHTYIQGIISKIAMTNQDGFRAVVKETPNDNFAWVMSGVLRIFIQGPYKLCIKSDDGSNMYLNGKHIINNDGLHGPEQKCAEVNMKHGRNAVTVTGFQKGGGAYMEATYK